ncbi:MAG: methionine gamma-lyase family protein, partial [Clostridia bacterium]|nr:methionine gamma-lyase family protein [Clostridia bacterium]
MYPYFNIDEKLLKLAEQAEAQAAPYFKRVEEIQRYNQQKMQAAFMNAGVSESHFAGSTGYGYDDAGREVLDKVFAYALGAEDAIVRHNFVSGTHTLTVALFGVLRPGDKMLCVTGTPYDTLLGVIGLTGNGMGSLREWGVEYSQVDLLPDGTVDLEGIEKTVDDSYKMVYIQRSRGYSLRPSLHIAEIEEIIKVVRKKAPNTIIMVDNCYGEYVEKIEPVSVGADLMAGSLIKNPGGGIAPTGGYIAGR